MVFVNRATRDQAKCLNDIPVPERHYDFLREGNAPGDQFKAIDQCQQSFGPNFVPHVKENEPPFENLCRELWCSNQTHALRAHPALEGTDCSAKPWPYGSVSQVKIGRNFWEIQDVVSVIKDIT